jgi:hypothetical protein
MGSTDPGTDGIGNEEMRRRPTYTQSTERRTGAGVAETQG